MIWILEVFNTSVQAGFGYQDRTHGVGVIRLKEIVDFAVTEDVPVVEGHAGYRVLVESQVATRLASGPEGRHKSWPVV